MINLPANLDDFRQKAKAAATRQTQEAGSGDALFLKMDKKLGEWGFGPEGTPVEEGSQWAVDPGSFLEGYIAWRDDDDPQSGVIDEVMTSAFANPIQLSDLHDVGTKRGWDKQVGFGVVCLTGEDAGQVCKYTTTSYGGKAAVADLLARFAEQLAKEDEAIVPVVMLEVTSYKHKKWGLTYNPVVNVVGFLTPDELAAATDRKQVTQGPAPAPEPVAPEPEPEPVAAAPAPVRRRRRRSA
jgi:hypothetical protein